MQRTWWKEAVVYQIYPRSFKDSDGDGIGDLQGIISKLDYLKELGVDVLWLSPIFKSPNDDNGYDISDYKGIMDEFGTMSDFEELLQAAHERELKILLDLVVNHCSDEHPWFKKARASKDSPYRGYYFWQPKPPNNWLSFFGGSAWEYNESTDDYYLHLFSKKQPDLNWENPKLREEIYSMMRFWLDKGVDGFRMDVITFLSKRLNFPNIDPAAFGDAIENVYANGPRIHEFLHEMNQEVLSHYDVMSMGEGIGVRPTRVLEYVGEDRKELNMLYHFDHMSLDTGSGGKFDIADWSLIRFKQIFKEWHEAVGERGWITIFLDNHDYPRMVSRFGNDREYRIPSAKLLGTLLLTMRGTPCIYQGSEIGMTNVAFPTFEHYRDIETLNAFRAWQAEEKEIETLLRAVHLRSRDNARTPMQWDATENAGFTTGKPWIDMNPRYPEINVQQALEDESSILKYYQHLLRFRKAHSTLVYGDFELLEEDSETLFAYRRWDADGEFLIVLNFNNEPQKIPFLTPDLNLALSNYKKEEISDWLLPWEARIYRKQR